MKTRAITRMSVCAAAALTPMYQAAAQTASGASDDRQVNGRAVPESGIADIVVTAERRSSSVQRTPIAISAVDSSTLRKSGISNLEGLGDRIPNLTFQRNNGDALIFIRGIGYNSIAPGNEARVALYADGVYQSRNQAALLGFYDVDRVEVLRGPQGTLYGRNAIAGTINILTRAPGSDLNGYFTGTVGDYGLIGTEGAIGGPLSSTVGARLSFRTVDRNGYGRNLSTGEDVNDERSRSVRAKMEFRPSAALTFRLSADYSKERDNSGGYRFAGRGNQSVVPVALALGGTVPSDKQDAAGFGPRQNLETYGFTGQADLELSDRTTITSLTGYRHFFASQQTNIDGSTAELSRMYITERSETITQELRLSQKIGAFADLILGGYLYHETNSASNQVPLKGSVLGPTFGVGALVDPDVFYEFYGSFGRVKTDAQAVFAQASIHLTEKLELDIGARYSHEKKRIAEEQQLDILSPFVLDNGLNVAFDPTQGLLGLGRADQKTKASSFDPKITMSYQASAGLFVYATYSKGFKSGGFNIGNVQPAFRPEKLTNYEAGFKLDAFDRRLRLNLSAFNYDYKDLQESVAELVSLVTKNATSARVRGLEAELTARPVDAVTISLNGAYLDAKFKSFFDTDPSHPELGLQNLEGNRLPSAPQYQIGGQISYAIGTGIGEIVPRVSATWFDKVYFTHFNTVEARQPARTLVNLYLGWTSPDARWSASAYIKNLTNDIYVSSLIVATTALGSPMPGQYGPPRTVGVNLTRSF